MAVQNTYLRCGICGSTEFIERENYFECKYCATHYQKEKPKSEEAAFEPRLDYVITKLPRFPFDKFTAASNTLGT
ncbi:MAG: hypothetical protein IJ999_06020, partial [Clostridia bacterium]|nr:hypothetical protein [Clostridia bacterium]